MKNNLTEEIQKYIMEILEPPREEFGGMPVCPFVKKDRVTGKLLIDVFDNTEENLLEKIQLFEKSEYTSAVFGQVFEKDLSTDEALEYQKYLNNLLNKSGLKHLKIICANPVDDLSVSGFNPRSAAPCFLITVTGKKHLQDSHKKMLKSQYFINFEQKYLDYLHIKESQLKNKNKNKGV